MNTKIGHVCRMFLFLFILAGFQACQNTDEVLSPDFLEVEKDTLRFSGNGGIFEIKVDASGEWTLQDIEDEAKNWCFARKKVGSSLAVWTKKNVEEEEKSYEITLVSGTLKKNVVVFQKPGTPEQEEDDTEDDDELIEDVMTIFTDETYSALKEGVTYDMASRIKTDWLQKIALDLYAKTYPVEDRIKTYGSYEDPSDIQRKLKTAKYSRHNNPTGIAVKAGDELTVCMGDNHGKSVSLEVMNWSDGFNSRKSYALKPGVNKLKMTLKGLVYFLYNTTTWRTDDSIKVHIVGGTINGVFDVKKNTQAQWEPMLAQAEQASGFLDLLGERAHWIFTTEAFQRHTPDPFALMEAYDQMMKWQHEIMGLEKYGRVPHNRLLFHGSPSKNPHASDYRTGYPFGSASRYLNVNSFKSSPWGPAHEAGHVHQTRPGLKWIGLAEVTNNIYSQLVTTNFNKGKGSRADYNTALQNYWVNGNNHAVGGGYFGCLAPFWQLYLYTKHVLHIDYYEDLHERIRKEPDPGTDGKRQLNFVKWSCDALQLDMTEYFEATGFLKEIDRMIADYTQRRMTITKQDIEDVKAYVHAKGYPKGSSGLIYLRELENIDMFKANAPVVAKLVTVFDTTVDFADWTNTVGYEVWKDGKVVAASFVKKFTVVSLNSLSGCKFYGVAADGTRVEATGIK